MSIKFQGSAIYLYGPPRSELDAIPRDYSICLHENHRVRTTREAVCYQVDVANAYHAVEDQEPALIFAKNDLQDHQHRLVISIANPLNETESYHGIHFSHAVYTIKRPTPWPVEEDSWKFREVAIYASHSSLSCWPEEPSRSWRFWRTLTGWRSKTYTTEDQSIVPWHELSSRDELDQEHWGVEATISGGAAALYGIPRAYITSPNRLGHICVQIDLGHCEVVDVRAVYLNTKNEDKPVLLWRNDALDPAHVTEISVRLVKGLYGRKRARMFPFKAIHYHTLDVPVQRTESHSGEWDTPVQAPERGLVLNHQAFKNPDICPWKYVETQESHSDIAAKVMFPARTRREYQSPTFWAQLFGVTLLVVTSLVTVFIGTRNVTEGAQRIAPHAPLQYACPTSPPLVPHILPLVTEAPLSSLEVKPPQSLVQLEPTVAKPSKDDDERYKMPAHIPVFDQAGTHTPPVFSSPLPPSPENQNNYGLCPAFSAAAAEPTNDEVIVPIIATSHAAQNPSNPSNSSPSAKDMQVAALLHQQQSPNGPLAHTTEGSNDQDLLPNPHLVQEGSRKQLLSGLQIQDSTYIPELAEWFTDQGEGINAPLQAATQDGQPQPAVARNHGESTQNNLQSSEIGHINLPQDTPSQYVHSQSQTTVSCDEVDADEPGGHQCDERDHSARGRDNNEGTNNPGRHQDNEAGGDGNEGNKKRGGRSGRDKRKRKGRGRGRGGAKT